MVLKLYSGETYLTTVYNVIKITQNNVSALTVKNKLDGQIQYKDYHYNKDYNRFSITTD